MGLPLPSSSVMGKSMTDLNPVAPKTDRKRKVVLHAKTLELVLVEWEDANVSQDDDGVDNLHGSLVRNVTPGFLLRKTRKLTELIQDVSPDENTGRGLYVIPNSIIRKIVYTGYTATTSPAALTKAMLDDRP